MGISTVVSMRDEHYMRFAIEQAYTTGRYGEVPVGAVVVLDDEIIARGYNCSITDKDPSAHAELVALRKAGNYLNNYRLLHTELYVTLEPCAMCFSALIHARVARLVFGADDLRAGVCGGAVDIREFNIFNHSLEVVGGVLGGECKEILIDFFKSRR